MQSTTVFQQSASLAGRRLALRPCSPARAPARAVNVQALFTKTKTVKEAPKKVLVTGKDVKATQFDVDLGFTRKTVSLGFTASNELFVGRAAMLGVAFAIIGELLTGKGALAQLGYELHESVFDVEIEILAVIAFNLIAAFLPVKGRFVPDEEEEKLAERPKGSLQDPRISLLDGWKFFGTNGFGFTKENELFVGRVAQLGFAAGLIGEAITGKGILGQFDFETGLPLSETEPLLLAFIAFTLFAAINPGTGKFVDEDK